MAGNGVIYNKKDCIFPDYEPTLLCSEFYELLGIGEEDYCRSVCHAMKSWEFVGNRKSGKPTTTLSRFLLNSEASVYPTGFKEAVDVFLSPNQFFDWRNTKQLSQLHANWIEIDTLKHEVLSEDEQTKIYKEVLRVIQSSDIPDPTCLVASGSGGLHLYWIYDGVEAYKWRVDIWRELTKTIAKRIETKKPKHTNWHIDYHATNDPSRVMRLPGSYHAKSGRFVTPIMGGPKYKFDDLAKELGLSPEKKSIPQKVVNLAKKVKLPKPSASIENFKRKHSIKDWWFRVYTEVCTHARSNGVGEGQRDLFAFILFVALRHIKKTPEEALEAATALNNEFIGLDGDELNAYLKTAFKTLYKYRKETLAGYLRNIGVSPDFLYDKEQSSQKLPADEVKNRQQAAAKQTATTRKANTLTKLIQAIKSLMETGQKVTQVKIAGLAGVCVRTVKRYWAEIPMVELRAIEIGGN